MHAINKIIFELGKKKVIDDQKKYKIAKKKKVKDAFGMMSHLEEIYDNQINNLKVKARCEKKEMRNDL